MDGCLDDDAVARYLATVRAGGSDAAADAHLDACAACRRLVFAVACTTFGATGGERAEAPAGTLGRYRLDELIATGGMGMVFAAFDPALQRKVAIKVLRRSPTDEDRAQLVREAQSLARLSHPNVVAVHDVGEDAGEVFLAMELLEGRDLAAWRRERPRTWREIVEIFAAVGGGLAAAHRAGIVHRDLKPSNVYVTRDGRVCLTDFGLATTSPGDGERVVGTPAYMAPEQLDGAAADARSDIYSYCVSLHETLLGRRPAIHSSARAGSTRGSSGAAPGEADGRAQGIPAALAAIVRRGLAEDPAARPPSIDELVRELQRVAGRRRRVAIGAAALVAVGAVASVAAIARREDPACTTSAAELAAAWSGDRAVHVAAAIAATGVPYAATTGQRASSALDDYARRWIAMHGATCRATHVDHTQSTELLDRRMACLDDRRRRLAAAVDALGALDRATVHHAIDIAGGLPSLSACGDGASAALPEDPALVARIRAIRDEVARAELLDRTGRVTEARTAAAAALAAAEQIPYRPLQAEAAMSLGAIEDRLHEGAAARRSLERGVLAAAAANDSRLEARALAALAVVVAKQTPDRSTAVERARHARALTERIADDPDLAITIQIALAVALEGIDAAEATRELDRGLALVDKLGRDDVHTQLMRAKFLALRANLQRDPRARIAARRVLVDAMAAVYGPDHPRTGVELVLLAHGLTVVNQLDEARELARRAAPLVEPIPASRGLLRGIRALLTTDPAERLALLEGAVADSEGTDAPAELAATLLFLSSTAYEADRSDRAAPAAHKATALAERLYGPTGERMIAYLVTTADIELDLGRYEEAERLAGRAAAIARAAPPSSIARGRQPNAESSLALAYFGLHRCADALPLLEQPDVQAMFGDAPADRAELAFYTAACEWELDRDKPRALRRAREALAKAAADARPADRRAMESWLAKATR